MKHTVRRRRRTSNWLYAILAGAILLITLCIISLIPAAISNEGHQEQSDRVPPSGTTSPTPTTSVTPAPAHIRITINSDKLSLLLDTDSNESSSSQNPVSLQEQLQELTLAQEEILAEREEFQRLYEETVEHLVAEETDYQTQQEDLQTELKKTEQLLEEANTALAGYSEQIQELTRIGETLEQEKAEIQNTEEQLRLLHDDIVHARELLASERNELETGIQNIKNNPNLSSDGKETALIPLYAALEQLLVREAGLEDSEADYMERTETLLAQKENFATRFSEHTTAQAELDNSTAPLVAKQQEHTTSIQNLNARIHTITIELERIRTEKTTFDLEYQDKLTTLDSESERLEQEKLALQEESLPSESPSDTDTEQSAIEQIELEQRALERIFLFLQNVSLTEDSNVSSDILLTDITDITLTTP